MAREAFKDYAERKTRRAASVETPGVITLEDRTDQFEVEKLEHPVIERFWGGPFYYSKKAHDSKLPVVNLVFVEDKNGNTGSDEPWNLGGGETDFMIYEGASRVHVDAIIAGSKTAEGIVLSTWHPDLLKFRTEVLKKPAFATNVLTTERGELDIENELIFNNPELQVVILTGDSGKAKLEPKIGHRSWVHVESSGEKSDLRKGMMILKEKYGVLLASAIGGRNVATELLDKDLVTDLYLTRTPIVAAPENTPFYLGDRDELMRNRLELVIRKGGTGPEERVLFEHYRVKTKA